MQRFYRLDMDCITRDFSIWQAAACAACLPLGSALVRAIDPQAQYTVSDFLLHRIGDILCGKHIPYPWEGPEEKQIADFGQMEIEDFKAWHAAHFAPVPRPYEGGCDG